jgi:hypothetical protein
VKDAFEVILQRSFNERNYREAEGEEQDNAKRHGRGVREAWVEVMDDDVAELLMDEIEGVGSEAGGSGEGGAARADRPRDWLVITKGKDDRYHRGNPEEKGGR